MLFSLAVITAVHTWITPVGPKSKAILTGIDRGEGLAMKSDRARWGQIGADEGTRRKIRSEERGGHRCLDLATERRGSRSRGRCQREHTPALDEAAGVRKGIPGGAPRRRLTNECPLSGAHGRTRDYVSEAHG